MIITGAVCISQLLNVTHTLQELNLYNNDIGDDGMIAISEALQHNKSLTTLTVGQCGLSSKGTIVCKCSMIRLHRLIELPYTDYVVLWLQCDCIMITTGAISISKMMMINHSLQELNMFNNNIGDNGISAIAEALGNCKIDILNISQCGITPTGASSLAVALSSNHTMRVLRLTDNPITVEGALLIVKSAVDNTVCQRVGIGDEYENDEIIKMMNILEDRRRQGVSNYVCEAVYNVVSMVIGITTTITNCRKHGEL